MTKVRSWLAPILRSETQARLLAALLLQTGREASLTELAAEIGVNVGNLHTEVERLVQGGVLADRRVGRTRLIRAAGSPLTDPLTKLLMVGYGPKVVVEQALRPIPGISKAFIVGSWAARYHGVAGPFPGDVDVVVVGSPDRDTVADRVEQSLAVGTKLQGQVIFRSEDAWANAEDAFTKTVQQSPIVELDVSSEAP